MTLPSSIVVVGPGRVGCAFAHAAASAHVPCVTVGRDGPDEALAGPAGTPIVVCTRADALADVIARTPAARQPDLVFVQNGMVWPFLEERGLAGTTHGLIYFAATARDKPVEPGAISLFFGPHAEAMVALLGADGIPARVLDSPDELAREIATKLAWNAIFGLLGDRFDEAVGESTVRHLPEITTLAEEMAPVIGRALRAAVPVEPLVARLLAYSSGIPTFRAGLKELPWRNGWIAAAAREQHAHTPLHDRLLDEMRHL